MVLMWASGGAFVRQRRKCRSRSGFNPHPCVRDGYCLPSAFLGANIVSIHAPVQWGGSQARLRADLEVCAPITLAQPLD